jgi:hypothetical protein
MITATQAAPILIAENNDGFGVNLSKALRHARLNHALLRLPNAASAELYLNGTGDYSDRKKHPLPCLMLLDVTLPNLPSFETSPWLQALPRCRQIVITSLPGLLDPSQFESAVGFGPNSILCKLPTTESLAAMVNVLREALLEESSLAAC